MLVQMSLEFPLDKLQGGFEDNPVVLNIGLRTTRKSPWPTKRAGEGCLRSWDLSNVRCTGTETMCALDCRHHPVTIQGWKRRVGSMQ